MDRMLLVGAEEVGSASGRMRDAADTMRRAASEIDGALERHQRFLDDWLVRLEQTIERALSARS